MDSSQPPDNAPPRAQESSLARQRRRPMWGCVKWIGILSAVLLILLFLSVWGGWFYLGSSNFEEYVRGKLEANIESKLGRDVTIGRVTFLRERPARILIEDLKIANAPGALRPHFAIIKRIEITGGVESFWHRQVNLGLIEVSEPQIFFEVFPQGFELQHNWPRWKRSAPRRFEITRMDIGRMLIARGSFHFNDRRHNIEAMVTDLKGDVDPAFRQGIYEGVGSSPRAQVRIQDYEPFDLTMRGAFFYRPGSLNLRSVSLRGRGIEMFVNGMVDPVSEAVYNLRVSSRLDLERVREIFRVEQALDGDMVLTGNLRGKSGEFTMNGDFNVPEIVADTYELSDLKGVLRLNNQRTEVDVTSANYGGGTITANYVLSQYAEPYPMAVDLRYNRIAVEKLFADWNVENTGLRGGATGTLHYEWNKNDLLNGRGSGNATLNRGAVAFGNARHPIPVGGRTRFALNRGTITFAPSTLSTDASEVSFDGTLRIEGLVSDLDVRIVSRDFGELDRIGYNFAHSAGKRDYELLGMGGAGTINGRVRGEIGEPNVVAHLSGRNVQYNNVALGAAEIDLRYDGPRGVLTFEPAIFREGDAVMRLAGTITFPDRGPSPRFDLDVEATNYPVEKALSVVELDFPVTGIGNGKLHVEGVPDTGVVNFNDLRITRNGSRLSLNGLISWMPGEGNVTFDLDLGAEAYPVSEILAFLDMKNIPVTGALTGTLHLEGPKRSLEGAGMVTIREGTVMGEPVDLATADLVFTEGRLKVTRAEVQSPAGTIVGEAEVDLVSEKFSYLIQQAELDVSKLKALTALNRFFGGRLRITSSGAGTFDQPEVVIEATLLGGTVKGQELPSDLPPPTFYFATRDGRLVIRGSGLGAFTIIGDGTIAPDGTLDGTARIEVTDLARALTLLAPTAEFPASGSLVVDLDLGGKFTPIEALQIQGTVPSLDVQISDHRITATEPIRFALANGRIDLQSYKLVTDGSNFSAEGFISLVGDKQIDLRVNGVVAAALLQLFVTDVRADGQINVDAGITGTTSDPRIHGTAEFRDAQVKFAGFPQLIDDITGTLVFTGEQVELDSLRANLGGGEIVAGGIVKLSGLKPGDLRLNVRGSDVSLRYFEGVTIDGDFDLVLCCDWQRMVLQGDVTVDEAVYFKDIEFASQVLNLFLERGPLLPEVAASWQERIRLAVRLNAPGTIAVRNNLAELTGRAELDLTGTLANPIILGDVEIDEGGKIRLQDKEYDVVRGTIEFQNPVRTDPYFDLTAETRQGEYLVTINLAGTLDNIRPTVTSDPPASDVTLLSLLGVGMPGEGNGSGAVLDPISTFTTTLLFQGLGAFGTRILPFADAVRLEGLLDPTRPSVTFEKRINAELRVIITYFTGGEDQSRNIEVVEWQVTPDWVLQFTRDTALEDAVSINARFRRRYEGRW